MKIKVVNVFLIFLLILFLYSSIQCLIPVAYFTVNQNDLNIKLSKTCGDIFDKHFDISISDFEEVNSKDILINFKNSVESNSSGCAKLSKTIFNRYQLIEIGYTDANGKFHGYSTSKSYTALIASTLTSLALLAISIKVNIIDRRDKGSEFHEGK